MDAARRRRDEDVRRLRELAKSSGGRIAIESIEGEPARRITLRLGYRSAAGRDYPSETTSMTRVVVEFPARYPFVAPKATITTPIFHPNVYTSGLICLGETWIPTETLDALVRRIIRLVTFDPLVTGGQPPANSSASGWYRGLRLSNPEIFPTDVVQFADAGVSADRVTGGVRFNDVSEPDTAHSRTVVACPACAAQLRLPTGRTGTVRCPSCEHRFEITT